MRELGSPEVYIGPMRILIANFLTLSLLACGGSGGQVNATAETADTDTSAEWVAIDGVEFPALMQMAPAEAIEAYVFAAKHPEVLEYMPCYCGCEAEAEPHISNYDCFIDAIDRSGPVPRVTVDPMGFG